MGLDMSLMKKTYVKQWSHHSKEEKFTISVKKGGVKYAAIDPKRISYIEEEVLRWRKANAIHAWFVNAAQDGNDDCKDYWVSSEQLAELLDLCEKVIAASKLVDGKIENGYTFEGTQRVPIMVDGKYIEDPTVAQELLPSTSGFFFGGTDYDEYYLEDIVYTRDELKKLLAEPAGGDYYYSSSW